MLGSTPKPKPTNSNNNRPSTLTNGNGSNISPQRLRPSTPSSTQVDSQYSGQQYGGQAYYDNHTHSHTPYTQHTQTHTLPQTHTHTRAVSAPPVAYYPTHHNNGMDPSPYSHP
ncbi:hypothetical protein EON65_42530, partial [archaeon]